MQQGGGWWDHASLLAAQGALLASRSAAAPRSRSTPPLARRRARGAPRFALNAPVALLVSGAVGQQNALAGEKEPASEGAKAAEGKRKSSARLTIEGMLAGALAGGAVECSLYPIDTIKTRLQVARAGGGIHLKGLYTGVWGNLAGVLPASAIFVGVYEPLKRKLLEVFPQDLSVFAHFLSGAAGGIAASAVRVPTEVVKQRLQTGEFTSAMAAVRFVLRNEGPKGMYAGYGSFLLRDLPFDAIQFALYEQIKIYLRKVAGRELKEQELALVGAASGALTGAITTPLDVIKTRLMTQGAAGKYKGIFDCVAKTVKEEGVSALCRGMTPRVIWIGIGGSIFFGVLERVKRALQ